MNLNFNLNNISSNPKTLLESIKKSLAPIKPHIPVIFILTILLMYGFLIFQINRQLAAEPTEAQIAEQQNLIIKLKFDQEAVDKIEQLEDQNVTTKALFKAARDNPFQDN